MHAIQDDLYPRAGLSPSAEICLPPLRRDYGESRRPARSEPDTAVLLDVCRVSVFAYYLTYMSAKDCVVLGLESSAVIISKHIKGL